MKRPALLAILVFGVGLFSSFAASPVVSNVQVSQRSGTKLVDISYDLALSGGGTCFVRVEISIDGGVRWWVPATTFTGDVGEGVSPGNGKSITWNAGADLDGVLADNCKARVTAHDESHPIPPQGMVYIPAGTFQMGDNLDPENTWAPVTLVSVSGFFIDRTEVTSSEYNTVKSWANQNGYLLPDLQSYDGNYPITGFHWHEAIIFANAKSEYQGLTPCYYLDSEHTVIYRTGSSDISNDTVDWSANGYRLPTEAEWEKSARGGHIGKRFSWGTNTIDHSLANYTADHDYSYDSNPTEGRHPSAEVSQPYNMPVANFAANAYGIYDSTGNAYEWCWDRMNINYYGTDLSDPKGADTANPSGHRVMRGGIGNYPAFCAQVSERTSANNSAQFKNTRESAITPFSRSYMGLRLVRIPSE
jgi:formylglycine-generating enzyme required for sulfatase activity